MLAGGFAWYSWVPATLVATSVMISLIPSSRTAGLIAGILWGVFAIIGIEHLKYFGPLGFSALGTLVVAIAMSFAPAFALWSIVAVAFVEAGWLASLARQALFELATLGHVTSTVDGCSTYFLPVIFAALMAIALATTCVTVLFTSRIYEGRSSGRSTHVAGAFPWETWRVALMSAIGAGSMLGVMLWRDWQIDRPCM